LLEAKVIYLTSSPLYRKLGSRLDC